MGNQEIEWKGKERKMAHRKERKGNKKTNQCNPKERWEAGKRLGQGGKTRGGKKMISRSKDRKEMEKNEIRSRKGEGGRYIG